MNNHKITPEKVTRPMQLLAAWLTGLVIVDGSFLLTAVQIQQRAWIAGVLVIAAILNVPLFLLCIYRLQTKFRPEMQEDSYYSRYLDKKYSVGVSSVESIDVEKRAEDMARNIVAEIGPTTAVSESRIQSILREGEVEELKWRIGEMRSLSELHLRPELWPKVVERWQWSQEFINDIRVLKAEGAIIMDDDDPKTCRLTDLGQKVAKLAEKENMLFNQRHPGRNGKNL